MIVARGLPGGQIVEDLDQRRYELQLDRKLAGVIACCETVGVLGLEYERVAQIPTWLTAPSLPN